MNLRHRLNDDTLSHTITFLSPEDKANFFLSDKSNQIALLRVGITRFHESFHQIQITIAKLEPAPTLETLEARSIQSDALLKLLVHIREHIEITSSTERDKEMMGVYIELLCGLHELLENQMVPWARNFSTWFNSLKRDIDMEGSNLIAGLILLALSDQLMDACYRTIERCVVTIENAEEKIKLYC